MTDKGTSGQSVQKSPELPGGPVPYGWHRGPALPSPSFCGYALDRSALRHNPELLGCAPAAPGAVGGGENGRSSRTARSCFSRSVPMTRCWVHPTCPCSAMSGCGTKAALLAFSMPAALRWKKTENILVFYQKLPLYNPQFEQGKPYKRSLTNNGDSPNYGKIRPYHGRLGGRPALSGECAHVPHRPAHRPPHAEAGGPVRVFHQDQ